MIPSKLCIYGISPFYENKSYSIHYSEQHDIKLMDFILQPSKSYSKFQLSAEYFIIPISGSIALTFKDGTSKIINPETIAILGENIATIDNTMEDIPANFLIIQTPDELTNDSFRSTPVSLNKKDALESAVLSKYQFDLGVFSSRYTLKQTFSKAANVIYFVINGAFEIAGRLVEYKDNLGFKNASEIEIEALSEDAILLKIHNK